MRLDLDLVAIPFRHSRWATRRLIDAAGGLAAADLDRRFDIGPGSVRRTFLHLISCERYWLGVLGGPGLDDPEVTHAAAPLADIAGLHRSSVAALERIALDRAAAGRLGERVTAAPGAPMLRVAAVLLHVITHGSHHRAQILNMLRHLDVRPLPLIDLDDWEQASGGGS